MEERKAVLSLVNKVALEAIFSGLLFFVIFSLFSLSNFISYQESGKILLLSCGYAIARFLIDFAKAYKNR